MIVRCGRCQVELEVSGPGEFVCPACGTRNAVRDGTGARAGYDLGGLTVPGGTTRPASPPPAEDAAGITWETCPECRWRFAIGLTDHVTCPSCRAEFSVTPQGLSPAN